MTSTKRKKPFTLKAEDSLSMFRCALYTAMGVRNEEPLPTDHQCLQWLQRVYGQAEYRNNPPIRLIPHPPVKVKTQSIVPEITILQWEITTVLPEWRDLPR